MNCVSFVEYIRIAYTWHTRRLHLHLYFALEWARWTDAVKLKRNHREFLRGEEGGWLSREDPPALPAGGEGRP